MTANGLLCFNSQMHRRVVVLKEGAVSIIFLKWVIIIFRIYKIHHVKRVYINLIHFMILC